ncbi:MAG: AAA family ATPase [Candidatus Bathyarchaeia archaeon]
MSCDDKIVIGITGMPAAGKSTAAEHLRAQSCAVVVMGDLIRMEAKRRGIEPTAQGLGKLMFQLREEGGPQVVARWAIEAVKREKEPVVVVDGIRSPDEVVAFRQAFPHFWLLAIDTPHMVRFRRTLGRGRSDDVGGIEAFLERERNEIEVGTPAAIQMADKIIEGESEELERNVKEFLKEVLRESSTQRRSKGLPHRRLRES